MSRSYSFVVPVFNRPDEIQELLVSMTQQTTGIPFEVVIVEDGSSQSCEHIIKRFDTKLNITYLVKANTGPGHSRNYGMERASGNYFLILDSDCILPPEYLEEVDRYLDSDFHHCFGGSDAAHPEFNEFQKAVSHVMTSFLTTGGIRGSSRAVSQFEPRSFNMGLSREAYEQSGGFGRIHPGEDPDLSLRLLEQGYKTTFVPNAFVYHKRRIDLNKFYRQVRKFGLVRPIISLWHPSSAKITFWFPSFFVLGVLISVLLGVLQSSLYMVPLLVYCLLIMLEASLRSGGLKVGILAVLVLFVQFFGYGLAFLESTTKIRILGSDPESAYPELFFN
ncbi:glycosyltransferase [Aureitalea marina]|uniref:Glycosyl transferase family 2 n=1 Tax=Aureitalea marina TaxID=930804 RepID=A0A2S7KN21_9FLAO|nr:glycosyltransferase [Aureitalea marina]PQB04026.1 glycosyl transferase family 2 [Aureitalea marina]